MTATKIKEAKMSEERASKPAQPNPRRVAKLEHYLKQGKVLMQTVDSVAEDGRLVSTLASLKRVAENRFVVGMNVYPTEADTGRLRDDYYNFGTFDEAMAFITRETGVLFHQMQI